MRAVTNSRPTPAAIGDGQSHFMEVVIKQATSEEPNRKWYEVSSQGLLDATKYVKDSTGNIAGTLRNLGKLLLGGT